MRPLKLRIEGFGAYAELQEVSFDEVELFAITGQTGAGKSTLLDAITYALYKTTPRIGSVGLKELKHPSAENARVELTFSMGAQVWRVVRVVGKENQNRLEYLQDGDWKTHPASEKVRELDARLAEILGMDYETFTRAILLPQGQFDLFLRGSPKERRETLIKLYGLESLKAMRDRVSARLKSIGEESARLQGELDALSEASEERLTALREEMEQLGRNEQHLNNQFQAAEKTLRTLEQQLEKYTELGVLQRRKASWQMEQPRMAEIASRLARAEKAERIWPQLEALQAAQDDLRRAQAQLEAALQERSHLEARLSPLRAGFQPGCFEEIRSQLARIPLLEVQEARLKRYGAGLNLRHAEPLPFDEDRLDLLRDAERQFAELSIRTERYNRTKTALEHARTELTAAQQSLAALEAELGQLRMAGINAKAEYEQAEQAVEAERNRQGIDRFRSKLRLGEPCPLCGHPVEQLPADSKRSDLAALEALLKAKAGALENLRSDFRVKQDRHRRLMEEIPRLEGQLEQRQHEEAEARAELTQLEAQLHKMGSLDQVREERTRRLSSLVAEVRAATAGLEVATFAHKLKEQQQTLEAQAQQISELEARLAEAQARVSSQTEIVRVLEGNLKRQQATVMALLLEAGFQDPDSVRQARLSPQETEALRKRRAEHEQDGLEIDSLLKKLDQELGQQEPVTPAMVAAQKTTLAQLRASLDEVKKLQGGKKSDLERTQEQLARKRQIMKDKASLDQQIDIWEQLANDLRGDRFQDFLLEHYQSGLLSRASELIRSLSQNRYTLHLEDGEYKVLDRWTEAQRPVRTLSGGESFMASLSLALSLSEHLSRGRIGALFLDEGFGTLDAETLEQVAGVLEALPTQGRLVGIVTHVEALAERLPARLQVEKSPSGSRVSWKD